jgi:hypothetical protein
MIHLPFQGVSHRSVSRRGQRILFPVRCFNPLRPTELAGGVGNSLKKDRAADPLRLCFEKRNIGGSDEPVGSSLLPTQIGNSGKCPKRPWAYGSREEICHYTMTMIPRPCSSAIAAGVSALSGFQIGSGLAFGPQAWYTTLRSGRAKPLSGLDFPEAPESSILSGSTSQTL